MAIRQIVQSDLSGTEVGEDAAATVVVSDHPSLSGPVELDVTREEAGKLQSAKLDLVTLKVYDGGSQPRNVVMDLKSFNALFKGGSGDEALKGARKSAATTTGRRKGTSKPKGDRLDYTSPEHAGKLHRGRVTEAEAEWVRNNQSKASANRKAQTGEAIDFTDAAEKKRYGL